MSALSVSPVVGLHQQVVDALGRDILAGELDGAVPIEDALARRFAVSRGVVREAVKALAAKGLVTVGPRVGTRTRPPEHWNRLDADVIRWWWEAEPDAVATHVLELRTLLEPPAAAAAAARGSRDAAVRLTELAHALADPDPERALAADLEFHRLLLAAPGNPLLGAIGASLDVVLLPLLECTGAGPRRRDAAAAHLRLAEAIAAGDPDASRAAAENLLAVSRRDYADVTSGS
jgi:DNA-binding FadR family transcriptional regulator